MRVVVQPVDDRGPGDGGMKDVGPAQHRQGRHVAAEGPAVDADAFQVHLRIFLAQRLQPGHLIVQRHASRTCT